MAADTATSRIFDLDPMLAGNQTLLTMLVPDLAYRIWMVYVMTAGLTSAALQTGKVLIAHTLIEATAHDLLGSLFQANVAGDIPPSFSFMQWGSNGRLMPGGISIFGSLSPVCTGGNIRVGLSYNIEPV